MQTLFSVTKTVIAVGPDLGFFFYVSPKHQSACFSNLSLLIPKATRKLDFFGSTTNLVDKNNLRGK
jgi:hypothetical protein